MPTEAVVTSGPFRYTSRGLLRNGIPRADLATLKSTLDPVRPKYARKSTYKPPKVALKWYSSQLGHYKITPVTGTKEKLEERLRAAIKDGLCDHQPDDLREMEESMRVTWIEKSKTLAAEEEIRLEIERKEEEKRQVLLRAEQKKQNRVKYASAITDDEKIAIDGGELWFEEFKKSGAKTAVLKHINHCPIWGSTGIYEVASENGVYTHSWYMESDPEHLKWITIGYDLDATIARAGQETKKYAPIAKKVLKAKRDAEAAEQRAIVEARKEFMKAQPTKWNSTHILGTWEVSCKKIQEGWSDMDDLKMTLFHNSKGDIVGDLELGIIEGVLKLKGKPTAAKPSVEIYWAGRETGEGEIITEDSDGGNRKGRIEFSGKGAAAKIIFDEMSCVGSKVLATAIKVSQQPVKGTVNFEQYSEEAYEYARRSRWGNSGW